MLSCLEVNCCAVKLCYIGRDLIGIKYLAVNLSQIVATKIKSCMLVIYCRCTESTEHYIIHTDY